MILFRVSLGVNNAGHDTGYVEILVDRVDVLADKLMRRCAEMKENVLEDVHDNREMRPSSLANNVLVRLDGLQSRIPAFSIRSGQIQWPEILR
jgi:hypothetical protein